MQMAKTDNHFCSVFTSAMQLIILIYFGKYSRIYYLDLERCIKQGPNFILAKNTHIVKGIWFSFKIRLATQRF
jgi:hypothetical protein